MPLPQAINRGFVYVERSGDVSHGLAFREELRRDLNRESDWNLPPPSWIISIVLRRSRVDRASRSSFHTTIVCSVRN